MKQKIENAFMKFFTVLAVVACTAMVLLIFINAVLRYVANSGITQSEELCRYFFVWTCFMGTVVAYKENSHVGLEVLTKRLKGVPLNILLLVQDAIVLGVLGVVLYGGIKYTMKVSSALTPACQLPQPVVTMSIVICGIAMIFLTVERILLHIKNMTKKGDVA